MGTDQQNEPGIAIVWRRTVRPLPQGIAQSRTGGTDVGMTVVPVDPPGLQDAVHIAIVPRATDVIHDLGAPILDEGLADTTGEGVEHLVPGRALPLPGTTRPRAFERV